MLINRYAIYMCLGREEVMYLNTAAIVWLRIYDHLCICEKADWITIGLFLGTDICHGTSMDSKSRIYIYLLWQNI